MSASEASSQPVAELAQDAVVEARVVEQQALVAAFRQLSPEAVRLRLFAPLKELTH